MKSAHTQVKRLPSGSLSGILISEIAIREWRDKSDAGHQIQMGVVIWEQGHKSVIKKSIKVMKQRIVVVGGG